jgi:hypothetical protein
VPTFSRRSRQARPRRLPVEGTATAATKTESGDFKARTATAKIRAGKTFGTATATIYGDLDAEAGETILVSVTAVSPAGILIRPPGQISILDDDGSG